MPIFDEKGRDISPDGVVKAIEDFDIAETNYETARMDTDTHYSLKQSGRKVDIYTEKQYNNWGWAVHSGALTAKELDRLESFDGAKLHGEQSVRGKTKEGHSILAIGAEHGIDNVVAIVSGRTLGNPKIERVYRIDSDNETYNQDVRKDIYDAERTFGKRAVEVIGTLYPEGVVRGYGAGDSLNYQEYRLERQQSLGAKSGGDNGSYQGLQDGRGSADSHQADAEIELTRYSLKPVDPVLPTSDAWKPTIDTAEAKRRFPSLWDVEADESETRNPTQIKSTVSTYRKIYDILKNDGFSGKILDASSGLGYGTRAGIEEYGFDVEDIEPYPDKSYTPKYKDYSALNEKYDAIISNAVLNVIPQDQRDALVVKMGQMLNVGGRIFINTRSKDVDTLASTPSNVNISPMEWFVGSTGSYQKGFTPKELQAYIQDALGSDFEVERSGKFGAASVIVTKVNESPTQYSLKDSIDTWRSNIDLEGIRRQLREAQNSMNQDDYARLAGRYPYAYMRTSARSIIADVVERLTADSAMHGEPPYVSPMTFSISNRQGRMEQNPRSLHHNVCTLSIHVI